MNVLVACEYSGTVRDAFRALGHNAWSCDLLPCDADPTYHVQGDVFTLLNRNGSNMFCAVDQWDLMIAHPPCTYLCNSGVTWLHTNARLGRTADDVVTRWQNMEQAAYFFRRLLLEPNIPRVAIENPIMHGYAQRIIGQKQTQVIQPWMFGHPETKATCLWLRGLPPLAPTRNVKAQAFARPRKERMRLHWLPQSKDRWKIRSKTFSGIAKAMAAQWTAAEIEDRRTSAMWDEALVRGK